MDTQYDTDITEGLSQETAKKRLAEYGPNRIRRQGTSSIWKLLGEQFSSPLILILIGAALLSWGVGYLPGQEANTVDAVLIVIIVVLSAFLGFVQNYRAEKTVESLRKMAAKTARVIRGGELVEIPLKKVVPGDVVKIEGGDIVPADAIVKEANRLSVNEAPLTGESDAVHKNAEDEVYMNTFVHGGHATAVVQSTGMDTRVGAIADELSSMESGESPFDAQVRALVTKVSILGGVLIAVILVAGLFKYGPYQSLLTAISLAVAAIPEGLPAVITLTLAIGARAMSKKNALIRKMSVTESVGTVNVICTDKTGTLTKNDMEVTKLWYDGTEYDVADIDDLSDTGVERMVRAGVLCNAAKIGKKDGEETFLGDATETASLKLGAPFDVTQETLADQYEHVDEIPFSSERKRSTHIYTTDEETVAFTKGASEVVLKRCSHIETSDGRRELTEDHRKELLDRVDEWADDGLRVLGFAYREGVSADEDADTVENGMTFLGFQAMMDPPHEEIERSLVETRRAGITTLMLTGDSPVTARAIADMVGLETSGVLTGEETEELEDEDLYQRIKDGTHVFARVSPFHKLRILKLLQEDSRVAMTGDGVNDVLALKRADVGIAMGERGTEVAKEASDIVLMDDNYSSIVAAIREGRRIFDNVRKFINYLFVSNIAEIFVIFILTLALTLEEPALLPIHLLWINLLTDGAPALALGADPARRDIMDQPPRTKNAPIVDRRLAIIIAAMSALYVVLLVAIYLLLREEGPAVATTSLFTGFVVLEFIRIAIIRAQEELGWLANPWLIGGLGISLALQIGLIYSPLAPLFHVVPLGWYPWAVMAAVAVIGFGLGIVLSKVLMHLLPDRSHATQKTSDADEPDHG